MRTATLMVVAHVENDSVIVQQFTPTGFYSRPTLALQTITLASGEYSDGFITFSFSTETPPDPMHQPVLYAFSQSFFSAHGSANRGAQTVNLLTGIIV